MMISTRPLGIRTILPRPKTCRMLCPSRAHPQAWSTPLAATIKRVRLLLQGPECRRTPCSEMDRCSGCTAGPPKQRITARTGPARMQPVEALPKGCALFFECVAYLAEGALLFLSPTVSDHVPGACG